MRRGDQKDKSNQPPKKRMKALSVAVSMPESFPPLFLSLFSGGGLFFCLFFERQSYLERSGVGDGVDDEGVGGLEIEIPYSILLSHKKIFFSQKKSILN